VHTRSVQNALLKSPKTSRKRFFWIWPLYSAFSKAVSTFAPDDDEEEEAGDWHTDEDEDEEDDNGNQDTGLHEPGIHSLNPHEPVHGEIADEDEYSIGDPPLPRYQCNRAWRSYLVLEGE
jgi:hypothetical protein